MPAPHGTQTLYELLEVGAGATFEEIEQSYQRIAAYLGAESLAVYSILDSDDAHSARAQLDEAYRTLSDPDRRAAYDRARKEGNSYPSMMVPASTGGSTSTADATVRTRERSSGEEERNKRLPVSGRSHARQPIRGPGARTGRAPLYGRDVGRSAKAADPTDVGAKKEPRYGRNVGRTDEEPQSNDPKNPFGLEQRREPRYGRIEIERQRPAHEVAPTREAPRQPAPPVEPEYVEEHHIDALDEELTPPPVVRAEPPRHEQPRYEAPRYEPPPPPPRPDPPARMETREPPPRMEMPQRVEPERPELIKTASDMVEPRQKPTIAPSGHLAASAKSKKRILAPSMTSELAGEVEYGGSLLRRLRESAGASLDEVAEITKVGKRHLIAIETNDFAALPAAVYTRGFVAEYARVLGLDAVKVTKSFMALYAKYRGVGG